MLSGFGGMLAWHRILQRLNREGALWVADLHQSPNPERSLRLIVAVVSTHRKPVQAYWVDGPDSPLQRIQKVGREPISGRDSRRVASHERAARLLSSVYELLHPLVR
jgi:hypothetical protein